MARKNKKTLFERLKDSLEEAEKFPPGARNRLSRPRPPPPPPPIRPSVSLGLENLCICPRGSLPTCLMSLRRPCKDGSRGCGIPRSRHRDCWKYWRRDLRSSQRFRELIDHPLSLL